MLTTSDAVPAAVGFPGVEAVGFDPKRSGSDVGADIRSDTVCTPDPLSADSPYFEAVAAALRQTGYLDS